MLPRYRDIATTLIARVIAMIGPFGVSIITARLLGPEERGRYFVIISAAQIAAQIANLGLHASNTFLAARRKELLGPLLVNSLYVCALIAPIAALGVAVVLEYPELIGLSAAAKKTVGPAIFLAIALAPLLLAFLYLSNMAVGVGRVQLFNGLTIFQGAAAVAVALAVGIAGGGTYAFLLAACLALVAAGLVAGKLLLKGVTTSWTFDRSLFREGVVFASRAYFSTLFYLLMMRVGIVALQYRGELAEIGQFSIAAQISDAFVLVPSTVGLLLFPSLLRIESEHRKGAMWLALWQVGGAMALLLIAAAAVTPFLLPLIFGAAYEHAAWLTVAMLPSVLLLALVTVISQYLAAEGYPLVQVGAWVAGFVLQGALSFWLVDDYGGYGLAIAFTASSLLVLVILLWQVAVTGNAAPVPTVGGSS